MSDPIRNKVQDLKDALFDELLDQFENGVKVRIVDKETGEVSIEEASVDSKIMTVAAKVIKDFAHELSNEQVDAARVEKLNTYLERRRGIKAVT